MVTAMGGVIGATTSGEQAARAEADTRASTLYRRSRGRSWERAKGGGEKAMKLCSNRPSARGRQKDRQTCVSNSVESRKFFPASLDFTKRQHERESRTFLARK